MARGRPRLDIRGRRFGKLVARCPTDYDGPPIWIFDCDCGGTIEASLTRVRSGLGSCGCRYGKERPRIVGIGKVTEGDIRVAQLAFNLLSNQERNVVLMYAMGMRRLVIAERLGIAVTGVATAFQHAREKLGIDGTHGTALASLMALGVIRPFEI